MPIQGHVAASIVGVVSYSATDGWRSIHQRDVNRHGNVKRSAAFAADMNVTPAFPTAAPSTYLDESRPTLLTHLYTVYGKSESHKHFAITTANPHRTK